MNKFVHPALRLPQLSRDATLAKLKMDDFEVSTMCRDLLDKFDELMADMILGNSENSRLSRFREKYA